MRAVIYAILWAILTTLICYLIYEFRQESALANSTLATETEQVQIIDDVDGSNYTEKADTESDEDLIDGDPMPQSENLEQEEQQDDIQDQVDQQNLDEHSESPQTENTNQETIEHVERAYIEFGQNSTQLNKSPQLEGYLDSVAQVVNTGEFSIFLGGHTDFSKSRASSNYQIGLKRAEYIKAMLMARNVSDDDIEVKSYGAEFPRIEGTTTEARTLNRRVELFIKQK